MNQDDSHALTGFGDVSPAPKALPAPPPLHASPRPTPKVNAVAADPFAVGVRVLRMAPAVLVAMTVCSFALVLLLGWMNGGGTARVIAHPAALNDARQARTLPAADAAGKPAPASRANTPEANPPANPPAKAAAAPENGPAPAAAQAPASAAPAAQQPAAPPALKAQAEAPARAADAAAKFTIQVGSFNDQSEANERVSKLRSAGFESRSIPVELQGRGTWYRVQVGRYADRDAASKALADVRSKGAAAGAIVVPAQN